MNLAAAVPRSAVLPRGIPLLMYHKVGAPQPDRFLNVTTAAFEAQMLTLKRMGYTGITMQRAANALNGRATVPSKSICITFDDAYMCVAENAAPVLERLKWPGTLFVPTAYVADANRWDERNGHPLQPIMDWSTIVALYGQGWEAAGHTHSHPRLAELTPAEATAEISRGTEVLAEQLGVRPVSFCYPFGSVSGATARIASACGYRSGCTTRSGIARPNSDPMQLPRVKIAYHDGVPGLLYRLMVRPLLP